MNSCSSVSAVLRSRITTVALFLTVASSLMSGAEMKAEDVIARHLSSIGTAEARFAVKSRIVQGTSRFKAVVSGGGELQGTGALVSEGRKAVVMIKLTSGDYRGEQFVTDGDKVSVSATTGAHRRSSFGEFVYSRCEKA
jgi:predicted membrane GTPase involved in stress response